MVRHFVAGIKRGLKLHRGGAVRVISALLILLKFYAGRCRLIGLLPPPVAHEDHAVELMNASSAVSAIVELYRDIVKDNVDHQITTWNNIVGLASDNYTRFRGGASDDHAIRGRTSDVDAPDIPPGDVDAPDIPPVSSGVRDLAKESPQTTATDDDIIWDRESDISTYFEELMPRCNVSYFTYHGCFGYLHSLAADPRCTTSLDSRYTCDGDGRREASRSVEDVVRDHLTSDTVNVIVIGAGPVGLLLANSLSHPGARGKIRTRVLVFENRVVEEGRKRPYTRDWMTELRRNYFGAVDPRISEFFRLVFEGDYMTFPVYIFETLLLLSCRDRGVKFVYGNYGDHADALAGVRNAIVFDATGHRLDLVVRDGDDPYDEGSRGPHRPALTTAATDLTGQRGGHREFLEFLSSRNATVLVAERETAAGRVWYPINRANGNPFQIHYLKMYRLWSGVHDEAYQKLWGHSSQNLQVWNESFNTKENTFCRDACNVTACDAWNVLPKKWKNIWKKCFVAKRYDWDQDPPRKDIMAALRRVPLEDAVFATSVSFLSLLPGQASAFANLHEGKRGVEIPLRDINLEALLADPIFQTNSIDKWLRRVGENANDRKDPLFALIAYHPFIYPDPVIPPISFSPALARLGAPVLRIGDSLFKGDPNSGNGLSHHVKAMSQFATRFWNISL